MTDLITKEDHFSIVEGLQARLIQRTKQSTATAYRDTEKIRVLNYALHELFHHFNAKPRPAEFCEKEWWVLELSRQALGISREEMYPGVGRVLDRKEAQP